MRFMVFPLLVFVSAFVILWLAAQADDLVRRRWSPFKEEERDDLTVVIGRSNRDTLCARQEALCTICVSLVSYCCSAHLSHG
jgi:hypothetical protein